MIKILIIRFSSIGDIVLTTPVIRCLKQQLKNAEIHYITKKSFEIVLANNPYIDKLLTINKHVNEQKDFLSNQKYDYIIDLHKNIRSWQVKRLTKYKKAYSFDKINLQKWLLVNLKINRMPKIHIVNRYLNTAAPLGIINDKKGLDYFIATQDTLNIADLGQAYINGYIGIVIGAKHNTKQLPTERLIELCKKIAHPILLLGGKEDAQKAEDIMQQCNKTNIINTCGKLNLNQSASAIEQAKLIITHDTGLMHIAAAYNKPIISIWGNTIPEFGMYAYIPSNNSQNYIFENKHLKCRPCSKIGFNACPKNHFNCMNKQPIDKIAKLAISIFLKNSQA